MSIHSKTLKALSNLNTREEKHKFLLDVLKDPQISKLYPVTEQAESSNITTHGFFIGLQQKNYTLSLLLPIKSNSLLHTTVITHPDLLLDLLTFTLEEENQSVNPFLLDVNLQNEEGNTLLHLLVDHLRSNSESNEQLIEACRYLFTHYKYEINPFIKNTAGQNIASLFENELLYALDLFKILNDNHCFIGANLQLNFPQINQNLIFGMTSQLNISELMPHTLVIKDYIDLLLSCSIDKNFFIKHLGKNFVQPFNSLCFVENRDSTWSFFYLTGNGERQEINIDTITEIPSLLSEMKKKEVRQQIEYYLRVHFGSRMIKKLFSGEDLVTLRHRMHQSGNEILQIENLNLEQMVILQNISILEGGITAILREKCEEEDKKLDLLLNNPCVSREADLFTQGTNRDLVGYNELISSLRKKLKDLTLLKNYLLAKNKAKFKVNNAYVGLIAGIGIPSICCLISLVIIGLSAWFGVAYNLFGSHTEPYTYTTKIYNETTGTYQEQAVNSTKTVADYPAWAAYTVISYSIITAFLILSAIICFMTPILVTSHLSSRSFFVLEENPRLDPTQLSVIKALLSYIKDNQHYFNQEEIADFPEPDRLDTLGLKEALEIIEKIYSHHDSLHQLIESSFTPEAVVTPIKNGPYPQAFFKQLKEIKKREKKQIWRGNINSGQGEEGAEIEILPNEGGAEIEIVPHEHTPLLNNNR